MRAVGPLRGGLSVRKLGHEGSKIMNGLTLFCGGGSWEWTHAGPGGVNL